MHVSAELPIAAEDCKGPQTGDYSSVPINVLNKRPQCSRKLKIVITISDPTTEPYIQIDDVDGDHKYVVHLGAAGNTKHKLEDQANAESEVAGALDT